MNNYKDRSDNDLRSAINYLIERESKVRLLNESFMILNTIRDMNKELAKREKLRKEKRDEV